MVSEFDKEKVFWTRKMNLKLVKFIKSRPNIWNPKHPKYTSINARDQTYSEFASLYGDEFTWQAVKARWTNIRSTFSNYLRKINASQVNEGSDVYKVNWHLWGPCNFLLKVSKKINNEDVMLDDIDRLQKDDMNSKGSSSDEEIHQNLSSNLSTNCEIVAASIFTAFKGFQNDAFGLKNAENGQIGRAVINKLSQMNSYEAAKMTHKIIEILLLYDEYNPLNPNTLKNESI